MREQETIETRSWLHALHKNVKSKVYGSYGLDLKLNWADDLGRVLRIVVRK